MARYDNNDFVSLTLQNKKFTDFGELTRQWRLLLEKFDKTVKGDLVTQIPRFL